MVNIQRNTLQTGKEIRWEFLLIDRGELLASVIVLVVKTKEQRACQRPSAEDHQGHTYSRVSLVYCLLQIRETTHHGICVASQ